MPGPRQDMAMGMYTRERVLAKTFAWRIIATLTGAAVAGLLTGEIETAGWFIVIEFPLKMGFYYFHERLWEFHKDSRTTAIPWPPPMHAVATPYRPPLLFNS